MVYEIKAKKKEKQTNKEKGNNQSNPIVENTYRENKWSSLLLLKKKMH